MNVNQCKTILNHYIASKPAGIKNINLNLFRVLTLSLMFLPFVTSAASCESYEKWAIASLEFDKDLRGNQYVPFSTSPQHRNRATNLLFGLQDEQLLPLFGVTLEQFNQSHIELIRSIPDRCLYGTRLQQLQQLRNQCTQSMDKNSNVCKKAMQRNDANAKLSNFIQSMLGVARPQNDPMSLDKIINHQKFVYSQRSKAFELMRDNPIPEGFTNNGIDALNALETLSNDPLLNFIDRDKQSSYRSKINNHQTQVMDGIIDDKINEYSALSMESSDLEKLRALINDYVTTKNSMGKYLSTRWNEYDTAYKTSLDTMAQKALDSFNQYLSTLPIERESTNVAYQYLNELFAYNPRPANFAQYRNAISNYSSELAIKIEEKKCKEVLANSDIGKSRDLPILGPRGEWTMGELICALSRSTFTFHDFVEPGFFSSEYTLELLNERGVSISISMLEKEAIKGTPTLVGTTIKDATSERELTVDDWQRLLESMLR